MKRNQRRIMLAALLVAGTLLIGGIAGTQPAGPAIARAAQVNNHGGATAEMLDFALNYRSASNYSIIGTNGFRTANGEAFGANSIDPQVSIDLQNSMRAIAQLPCETVDSSSIGGRTFGPGVYCLASADLAGLMTLDGNGDANSRFVFRVAGSIAMAPDSSVELINGARSSMVTLVAGDTFSLGARTRIAADLISDGDLNIESGSTVWGRAISVKGQVTINDSVVAAGTGYIEVCKNISPGDPIPAGTLFTFNVAGSDYQAPAGGCTAPIQVTSGPVTVIEAARTNTAVVGIDTTPATRLISSSLGLRQAVVSVPEGDVNNQTVVTFTNQTTRTGVLEICKYALDTDVTGFFQFTVQGAPGQTFAVPVGFCSTPITATIPQQPDTVFSANVTELARDTFRLESIDTLPINQALGFFPNLGFNAAGTAITNTNGGYVNLRLQQGGANLMTVVNFYNRSLPGRIKVCKITANPTGIPVGTLFRFTISGLQPTSPTQTMPGVSTTVAFDAPAGPASQNGFCVFAPGTYIVGTPVQVDEVGVSPLNTTIVGPGQIRTSRIRGLPGLVSSSLTPAAGSTQTFQTAGPVPIVDFATINVPVTAIGAGTITDVNVGVRLNHTFDSDLVISAIDPNGLSVSLAQNRGSSGDNFGVGANDCTGTPTTFDDAAVTAVSAGIAPFSGSFKPEQLLSAFNGRSYNGMWTIRVADQVSGDTGTFGCGRLTITTSGVVSSAVITARNTTAEVEFTNYLFNPAILKVCKLGGTGVTGTFSFTMSLPDPLQSLPVSTTPISVPVGSCTFAQGPFPPIAAFPGIGTFNQNTQLTLTEAASGATVVTSITSPTGGPISANLAGRAGTITLNQSAGVTLFNEITFLNSNPAPGPGRARFDFDGDGKSDEVIFRSGTWWYGASGSGDAQTPIQFGSPGDKLVAADYDGDGKTDAAVYRNGTWYVLGSTAGVIQYNFGLPTDIPQPGDFDGDGKADFAVFRPSDGNWYIQRSTNGFKAVHFGISTDKPVAADFDGDGAIDPAVYRNGTWYILGSTAGFYGVQFGTATDIPVQADYDGDRKADMAVYRGGTWYMLGSSAGFKAVSFGLASDTPVPADYDGDGITDTAVYRPSTNVWHILRSSGAQTLSGGYVAKQFGSPGDVLLTY